MSHTGPEPRRHCDNLSRAPALAVTGRVVKALDAWLDKRADATAGAYIMSAVDTALRALFMKRVIGRKTYVGCVHAVGGCGMYVVIAALTPPRRSACACVVQIPHRPW